MKLIDNSTNSICNNYNKYLCFRYYNREAVVISALQVEKHPITTPGPLTASPSATRLHKGAMGIYTALQLAKGVSGSYGSCHTPFTLTPQGLTLHNLFLVSFVNFNLLGILYSNRCY